MTNDSEQLTPETKDSQDKSVSPKIPDSPSSEKKKAKKTPPKSMGRFLLVLLSLSFVAAVGYSGYWSFIQFQSLNTQMAVQEGKVFQLEQLLSSQLPGIDSRIEANNTSYQAQLGEVKQYLVETARRMTESQGITRYEWLLAEAEYLMRLAQQRLQLERDTNGALAILQSADAVLRDSGDANLIFVREQLAVEMAELARVQQVDREGLYLRLNVLIEAFNQWSPAMALAEQIPVVSTESAGWKERFSKYFSINKIDSLSKEPVQKHLIPLYRAILQHSLAQAQTALLKNQTEAFQASISRAEDWFKQYGSSSDSRQDLAVQLEQLSQIDLQTELPQIGKSLSLLKGYIAEIYLLQRSVPEEQSK